MPAVLIPEMPFSLRLRMRERVLAWISRDTGLKNFLLPDSLAEDWTIERKEEWITAIIDNFLHGGSFTVGGKEARKRVLSRELSGNLRRNCAMMRGGSIPHNGVALMGVMLESLWDKVSVSLDDSTWAQCSLLFDTALVAIRVTYVWVYMHEDKELSLEGRRLLYGTLVKSFFTSKAPTDDNEDKHSSNFKDLLEVWRGELHKYQEADDFEDKLARLEETQSFDKTVACVEAFLNMVDIDKSWMLAMQHLEDDHRSGVLIRKDLAEHGVVGKKRKSTHAKSNGKGKRIGEPLLKVEQEALDEGGTFKNTDNESDSSFEPRAEDSDFDVRDAIDPEVSDDADEADDKMKLRNVDARTVQEGQPSSTFNEDAIARRSPRTVKAGGHRRSPRTKATAGRPSASGTANTGKSSMRNVGGDAKAIDPATVRKQPANITPRRVIAKSKTVPAVTPRTRAVAIAPRQPSGRLAQQPLSGSSRTRSQDGTREGRILRTRASGQRGGRRTARVIHKEESGNEDDGGKGVADTGNNDVPEADVLMTLDLGGGEPPTLQSNGTAGRRNSTRANLRDRPPSRAERARLLSAAIMGDSVEVAELAAPAPTPTGRRRSLRSAGSAGSKA